METIKKMNFKNELKVAKNIIFSTISIVILLYFIDLNLWISFIVIMLVTLPSIYLHLSYSLKDQNKILFVDDNTISLKIDNEVYDLNLSEKIIIRGSVGLTRSIIPIFIWPTYYDISFLSDKFEEQTISSLVDINLRDIVLKKFDNKIISYDYFILY